MKHDRSIVSIKQIHQRALKDISEVLEQNYITQNISEALEQNYLAQKI